jgi:hypothetical protein
VKALSLTLLLALPVLAAPPKRLTIAYTGDVGGEVAPCG